MVANPPENTPRITPYLYYEDAAAALDWLSKALGFRERMRMADADGVVSHAEMELEGGVIMLGCPGPQYQNPKRSGHMSQSVTAYVDDVDAHYERAKAGGATIVAEPEDVFYGDRRYTVEDLEGHHWFFAQHIRDVPPEEMKRPG